MNSVVQFLKRLAQILFFLVVVVFLGSLLIGVGGLIAALRSPAENVEKPSILALDLDGIIVDTRDIVENLRKYRTEDRIKGVLLRINSPGGVVGPSSGTLGRAEKIQLSSCPGPQPFQSGAPSRHPPGLQTKALRRLGRVERPRGLIAAGFLACCAQRK